ncbi:Hypothetical protein CINCED_3A025295 [Cinara cedri]|uniref:MGAT4 conserved region domain-containing protein n=1 Tax=Cinara cedri TaxID=506608 RepID=A0A5E4MCG1_9HEMI|nr:Hypothetical protein CINCED_3A025295 [Cinara cedri]
MGWTLQQPRSRHLLLLFMTFALCVTVVFISKSGTEISTSMMTQKSPQVNSPNDSRDLYEHSTVAYKMAEMEMRVDQLTRLYELKDNDVQDLIKRFSSVLKSIVKSLNVSVTDEIESLIATYNKSIETIRSPMANFDVFTFLPHLRSHKNYLRPLILHSGNRNAVSIVFGVPTVRRQQTYLIQTLINLVSNMNQTEQKDSLIVVMIGETDQEYIKQVTEEIKSRLPEAANSGLLDIIAPSPEYYPDFSKLRLTLGDSEDRVRWRSKQNLDFVFLMMYCQPKGSFYVQLEDDVVAKPQFHSIMKKTALQKIANGQQWFILDFCRLGFIGKMMRCSDLPWLIQFIVMFYNDKPGDWLLDGMIGTKACNLEKDDRDCRKRKNEIWVMYSPSLFQHIGTRSSLNGKIQLLKDSLFKKKINVKRINKIRSK